MKFIELSKNEKRQLRKQLKADMARQHAIDEYYREFVVPHKEFEFYKTQQT